MKQGMRMLLSPSTFFNQLQWSRHHWLILLSFLFVSAIEAHVGRQHALYQVFANFLTKEFNLSFDIALWLVVTAKLFFMLLGSFLAATSIWFIGNIIGEKNSQRVLFRRLSIVFTVALAAYTAHHLENTYEWMGTASFFLYFWSALLGYFAIREQFILTHAETGLVGGLAILLVLGSWHLSNHFFEITAKKTLTEIVYKTTKSPTKRLTPKY